MATGGEETKESFFKTMNDTVASGFITIGLALGHKLKLFEAFGGNNEQVTSEELARRAKCKERYIREWLHHMVVSDVVEVDESGTLFSLHSHRQEVLTDPENLVSSISVELLYALIPHREILECIRIDGPSGVPMETVAPILEDSSESFGDGYVKAINDILAVIPEMKTLLDTGARVCEIGIGKGKMIMHLSSAYPKSTFVGLELSEMFANSAREELSSRGLTNLTVYQRDASTLPTEWHDSFDVMLMRDVLHDMAYPDKALASMYRCLKPGGKLSIIEMNFSKNLLKAKENQQEKIIGQTALPMSIYHCLAGSMYYPGSAGLGPCCGRETIEALILDAGFVLRGRPQAMGSWHIHFLCEKPVNKLS